MLIRTIPPHMHTVADATPDERALGELVQQAGWPAYRRTTLYITANDVACVMIHTRTGVTKLEAIEGSFHVSSYQTRLDAGKGAIRTGDALPAEVRAHGLPYATFLELVETHNLDAPVATD